MASVSPAAPAHQRSGCAATRISRFGTTPGVRCRPGSPRYLGRDVVKHFCLTRPTPAVLKSTRPSIYALSARRLASGAEWQQAIRSAGFSLELATDVALPAVNGFLPARLQDVQTGFECYNDHASALLEAYPKIRLEQRWIFAFGFRFGGNFNELLAAWMAATAYARATEGVVFDPQEGKLFTPSEAIEVTQRIEKDRPIFEKTMQEIIARFGPDAGREGE